MTKCLYKCKKVNKVNKRTTCSKKKKKTSRVLRSELISLKKRSECVMFNDNISHCNSTDNGYSNILLYDGSKSFI